VGKSALKGIICVIIALAALALLFWLNIHPIYIIIMGLVIGLAIYGINLLQRRKQ